MQNLLFQASSAVSSSCTFGGINSNDWIGISALVILLSLTIAGLVYLIANFAGGRERERIRGFVRFELGQAIISMLIIVIIMGIATTACNVSLQLTQPSQDSFSFAQHYVGGLLFVNGIGLMNSIYSTSIAFTIYSGVLTGLSEALPDLPLNPLIPGLKNSKIFAASVGAPDFSSIYKNYATVLTDVFIPLVVLSFSMLFLQFLALPLIQAAALTVVLPVALIMRSLSFTGPRLRQAANEFLAIALAFYFIFPMTFVMDAQIINWMYCTPSQASCANPYPQYSGSYNVPGLTQSSLFGSAPQPDFGFGGVQLPTNFYGSAVGEFFSTFLKSSDPLTAIFAAPAIVTNVGMQVAGYIFQTTVLIALDLAITIGLAAGLAKGISAALNFLGSESLFS
ncbi:MAG: hypothetical protein KGH65_01575 [Candidatus Micrarchaeota archaeon]|nr:hypothetical protein [Candidatus Micrarchaeota archaeon]